ncbi:MAG TPA: hydantoinase/oxoprolinase family protein [Steroidobacteraceae bacterium]|nr:hydantoinase/oxoprolinase family protein [Steroidobacteraceae bacterium]HRX89004.1 hydantoinase/oxoprolinase family protein [Steroidobacteraceae bacterium]
MSYRLGVDVGGTFTDLLLVNDKNGRTWSAKVPSTPADQSIGVLNGISRICGLAGIEPSGIEHVMHGTTVATNTVLTGTGAKCGLVTTKGYRQVLQIARSYVPGGLGGWVIYNKSLPMAGLASTIEADERVSARGEVVHKLDEAKLRKDLQALKKQNIEALTVCLINSFANDKHEKRIKAIAAEEMPDIPVSLSSEVVPEMQEYERTVTTVANSYVRPRVARYVKNLKAKIEQQSGKIKLHILRSDGGLASAASSEEFPVNMLMSGPAGGVTGAVWVAQQAGFPNLLTADMGGTSTDVALIQNGQARLRRETTVGDVTVRASSVDIRTVGAGGGSIAHVPELTKALRVGPQSAGADPGPAAYGRGGTEPTVADANVVLGYIPDMQKLGGDMVLDRELATQAVQKVADALGMSLKDSALGIYNIVNENMVGALRMVSVEQGYDPRDYALIAFGGAGPIHANALSRLLGSWPSIIPPGPGVLCALGDATTAVRDERARTYVRKFSEISAKEVKSLLQELQREAAKALEAEGVPKAEMRNSFEVDLRYHGQGLRLAVQVDMKDLEKRGLKSLSDQFDAEHKRLFTFALNLPHELVSLRAAVLGKGISIKRPELPKGGPDPKAAAVGKQASYMDGKSVTATVYDRAKLKAGNKIKGPAIVMEMDSTTVILPKYHGVVDKVGCILIYPDGYKAAKSTVKKRK